MPGHPVRLFTSTSIQQFECAICLEVLKNPRLVCNNGHTFCQDCIQPTVDSSGNCPSCREKLSPKYCVNNIVVRDCIGKLEVRCNPAKEHCCGWVGLLDDRDDHLRLQCPFGQVCCPYEGCKERIMRQDLEKHTSVCGFKTENCSFCTLRFNRDHLDDHKQVCPFRLVECASRCGESVKFTDVEKHKNVCPNVWVNCSPFVFGCCKVATCNGRILRRNLKTHIDSVENSSGAIMVRLLGSNLYLETVNQVYLLERNETEKGIGDSKAAFPIILRWLNELKRDENWTGIKKICERLSMTTNRLGDPRIVRFVAFDTVDLKNLPTTYKTRIDTGIEPGSTNVKFSVYLDCVDGNWRLCCKPYLKCGMALCYPFQRGSVPEVPDLESKDGFVSFTIIKKEATCCLISVLVRPDTISGDTSSSSSSSKKRKVH